MWTRGQPDGGSRQNYVGIKARAKSFNDLAWDDGVCVSCEIQRSTVFTLRGACQNSKLESEFYPTICKGYIGFVSNIVSIWYAPLTMVNGVLLIIFPFVCSYDEKNNRWVGEISNFQDFKIVSNTGSVLGSQEWTVHNDSKQCGSSTSYTAMLSFSSCTVDQFTCSNGNCMDMEKR